MPAQCDVQTLLDDAACFTCLSPGVLQILEVALLCQIFNSAGGGGLSGKEIFSGNGSPVGVVTPSVDDALFRQLDSVPAGLIWTWKAPGPWIAPES